MKKIFIAPFLCSIVIMPAVTSCAKNDISPTPPPPQNTIGNWEGTDWFGYDGSGSLILEVVSESSKTCAIIANNLYWATDLIIPNTVYGPSDEIYEIVSIGEFAFYQSTIKDSVFFGDNVISIGASSFNNCNQIRTIDLNNVQSIQEYAFFNCTWLQSLDLKSVQTIGSGAFANCNRIDYIHGHYNSKPTTWGNDIFSGWRNIGVVENTSASNSYTSRGFTLFLHSLGLRTAWECTNWDIVNWDGTDWDGYGGTGTLSLQLYGSISIAAKIVANNNYTISSSQFIFPSKVRNPNGNVYDLTAIGNNVFQGYTALTHIDLNYLGDIGSSAFSGCTSLTSIDLGQVNAVGSSAFSGCTSLTSITGHYIGSPSGLWANTIFDNCPLSGSVKNVNTASDYHSSSLNTFLQDHGLPTNWFSSKNDYIGNWNGTDWDGFAGGSLILIYDSNLSGAIIQSSAAYQTTNELYLPDLVEDNEGHVYPLRSIGDDIFRNNANLTLVSLPDSIIEIGSSAFSECTNLTHIDLAQVNSLKEAAFSYSGLTSINLGQVNTVGSSAFSGCTSLTSIDLGQVNTVGSSAFSGCTTLNSITGHYEVNPSSWVNDIFGSVKVTGVVTNNNNNYTSKDFLQFLLDNTNIPFSWIYFGEIMGAPNGMNWSGRQSGSIGLSYEEATKTANVVSNSTYQATNLIFPRVISNGGNYYKLTTINDSVFRLNTAIYGGIEFNCINNIRSQAFYGCTGLTHINLDHVSAVGNMAFMNCSNVDTIYGNYASVPNWTPPPANVFANFQLTGLVRNYNPLCNSGQLMTYLKGLGLPNGWYKNF